MKAHLQVSLMVSVLAMVVEGLSGLIMGLFYGFLWGLTVKALIICGGDVDCVHAIFDRVVAGFVLHLAADGILSEAALALTLPGTSFAKFLIRALYSNVVRQMARLGFFFPTS